MASALWNCRLHGKTVALVAALTGCAQSANVTAVGGAARSTTTDSALVAAPVPVFSWSPANSESADTMQSFSWIAQWANNYPDDLVPGTTDQYVWVNKALTDLMPKPAGQRSLFFFHGYEEFLSHPLDAAKASNGTFAVCHNGAGAAVRCVYPDFTNGIAQFKVKFDTFFRNYKARGGEVDRIVLDYEGGISVWHGLTDENYAAIEADPRFAQGLDSELGFSPTQIWAPASAGVVPHYLVWNEVTGLRVYKALNEIIFATAQKYFPKIQMSNYGAGYHSAEYKVPEYNGHKTYLTGHGGVIGTHQAPVLYGGLGQITNNQLPEGATSFAATAFNALLYDQNSLRANLLSSPGTPVSPWVAYRSWRTEDATHHQVDATFYSNSSMYEEMIFHSVLSGVDSILFWNAELTTVDDDNAALARDMREVNALVGYQGRKPLTQPIAAWDAPYVLSGMQVGHKKIYRLTPRNMQQLQMQTTATQLIFKFAEVTLALDHAHVLTVPGAASAAGFWIEVTD